ncbi:MAG: TssN family type VI secretion system protein [Bacteroidales bacterium]
MTPFFKGLTMTYLLWPLLGILLVLFGVFIAKKNALLGNKRLIGYTIVSIVILVLPALLGFLDYSFMPYGYLWLSALYLVLGWYNIRLITWVFKDNIKYKIELVLTLFIMIVAMLFFALIFNLCNDLKYGFWASTSLLSMLLTSLFMQSYRLFLYIPTPIYRLWKFSDSGSVDMYENIDFERLKVVSLEIYKQEGDNKPLHLKGKVPDDIPFGVWVKRLIQDYNKKTPMDAIGYKDLDGEQNWIFYTHNSVFMPKRYIDCEQTVRENHIGENSFIIAKRVKEYTIVD